MDIELPAIDEADPVKGDDASAAQLRRNLSASSRRRALQGKTASYESSAEDSKSIQTKATLLGSMSVPSTAQEACHSSDAERARKGRSFYAQVSSHSRVLSSRRGGGACQHEQNETFGSRLRVKFNVAKTSVSWGEPYPCLPFHFHMSKCSLMLAFLIGLSVAGCLGYGAYGLLQCCQGISGMYMFLGLMSVVGAYLACFTMWLNVVMVTTKCHRPITEPIKFIYKEVKEKMTFF